MKKNNTMNCCGCNKPIKMSDRDLKDGRSSWYGKYVGSEPVKVICDDCIQDEKKREDYRK